MYGVYIKEKDTAYYSYQYKMSLENKLNIRKLVKKTPKGIESLDISNWTYPGVIELVNNLFHSIFLINLFYQSLIKFFSF